MHAYTFIMILNTNQCYKSFDNFKISNTYVGSSIISCSVFMFFTNALHLIIMRNKIFVKICLLMKSTFL